jgi:hypothetical protein
LEPVNNDKELQNLINKVCIVSPLHYLMGWQWPTDQEPVIHS